jgi:hypothetical protein
MRLDYCDERLASLPPPGPPSIIIRTPTPFPNTNHESIGLVESPHAVFGKRPGWLKRRYGDEVDRYWPTDHDVRLFEYHMNLVNCGRADFDPLLISYDGLGWVGTHEQIARLHVKTVRDHYATKRQPKRGIELLLARQE